MFDLVNPMLQGDLSNGPYPERQDIDQTSWDRRLAALYSRLLKPIELWGLNNQQFIDLVDSSGYEFESVSETNLQKEVELIGQQLRKKGMQMHLVARGFAIIRELSWRTLKKKHYRVQLLGGLVLLKGQIAEMQTGEGKSLTATLAAGLAAMAGIPVHIVTVNDYLAARDAEEMAPLYQALGLSVGVVQNGQALVEKRKAYRADITYCTNKELGFDYLRDRLLLSDWPSESRITVASALIGDQRYRNLLLRGLHFAIIDEADSVLIDEARTPLIISSQGQSMLDANLLKIALDVAANLQVDRDYDLSEKQRSVKLKGATLVQLKNLAKKSPELNKLGPLWVELVTQALTAIHLYQRDKHYLVKDDQVQIVDEYTGRLMPDRSWEQGLHQLIEAKEDCTITNPRETLARITYQRFFRRYLHLSGMTGTADEVADELSAVYRLKVTRIPTNKPSQKIAKKTLLMGNQKQKWQKVVAIVQNVTSEGRPVLVGTHSVEASEQLSDYLAEAGIAHQVLNARQDAEEAHLIAQAGIAKVVTVATNMAGRGTDIKLGEGVARAGGLHVILTEFHDSSRVDRQLYGRCGRQGDPGSFQAIVATDDELFRHYAPVWLLKLANYRVAGSEKIYFLLRSISQGRAERQNAEIRHQTMDHDRQIEKMLAFSGQQL